MNYKLVKNDEKLKYSVVETQTEQIIREYVEHSEAKKLMKHLNLGGAFDGNTPTFFLKKVAA